MSRHQSRERATAIGTRVMLRRRLLGLSLRTAAARAGIHHTTLGRYESGEQALDSLTVVAALAEALQCPIGDLTGEPPTPTTRAEALMSGRVYAAMRAVVDADLRYPAVGEPVHPDVVTEMVTTMTDLSGQCRYSELIDRLPVVLSALHRSTTGPDGRHAVEALVMVMETAAPAARYLGWPGVACQMSDRAQQAAELVGNPVLLGLAGWSRAQAALGCGLMSRAHLIASRSAEDLDRQLAHRNHPHGVEVLGMLRLTEALSAQGSGGDPTGPLGAATDLASRTGETDTYGLMFGPLNVLYWLTALRVDAGDPAGVVEVVTRVGGRQSPRVSRNATWRTDVARACAALGRDGDATRHLLVVERTAPERLREPLVAETLRLLLMRLRSGVTWGTELRGLCQRTGVAAL